MDYRFGPVVENAATTFRLYAPSAQAPQLVVKDHEPIGLESRGDGFWVRRIEGVGEGSRYRFRVGDLEFPDLASREQDGDNSGWSIVRRPFDAAPADHPRRPWHEAVICEVHVGAATKEGTFLGLADKLEHFRDAGYTAIEVMPIHAFPGTRNWGYDGTLMFAPASAYGSPADLRSLVDRAHALGLTMLLDVVYNHFGEANNFASDYVPEWFSSTETTPWGPSINFENEDVVAFYCENAVMWLLEYDFDGLRFDAIHEMKTAGRDHVLEQLARSALSAKSDAWLIIENIENSFYWLERDDHNRPARYLAQWNDDMHHALTYLTTREGRPTGYDEASKDPYADLEKALADGFVHDPSEGDSSDGRTRGGDAAKLPPDSFITYIQNHDQIGNRGDSLRIAARVAPPRLDFMHFIKFLAPQIPLCFMGDEANLETPFPFFFDLPEAFAAKKRNDRYVQLRDIFRFEIGPQGLPDPGEISTYEAAKLDWAEYSNRPERSAALDRFRTLAAWRRERVWPLAKTPCLEARTVRQGNCLVVTWRFEVATHSIALNPTDTQADMACIVAAPPVWTGDFIQNGEVLRLGSWSAVSW